LSWFVVIVLVHASPVDKLAIILATAAANASLWDPKLDVHRPVFPVVSWGIFLETAVLL
jgi:hypothetical protein